MFLKLLSQRVWATGTCLAKRTAQKSASAAIRGKRAYLIGAYTESSLLQHRPLSYSCVRHRNSGPVVRPSRPSTKSRPKPCNGGGQMHLTEDKRSFHTSLCARRSRYLSRSSRLLHRLRWFYSSATRHVKTCTWYRVPAIAFPLFLPYRTNARLFGSIKVHFKDAKGTLLKTVEGNEGDSLLDIAHEYDIDLEGVCPCIHRYRSSWTNIDRFIESRRM